MGWCVWQKGELAILGLTKVRSGQGWSLDLAWIVWLVLGPAVCLMSLYSPAETGHLSGGDLGTDLRCGLQLCIAWVTQLVEWIGFSCGACRWASESCVPVAGALDGGLGLCVWILVSSLT